MSREAEEQTRSRSAESTGLVIRIVAPGTIAAFPLPRTSASCFGRGLAADIRIPMPDMSRRHALLTWAGGLHITDLDSANGTIVRGQRLTPNKPVPLALREPILIADAALFLQEGSPTDAPTPIIGGEAFEAALQAHLRLFEKTKSPFGVWSIEVDAAGAWTDLVIGMLAKNDVVGILSETSVRVLLLDRTPEQLTPLTEFLSKALAAYSTARKVSLKACPRDGTTSGQLHVAVRGRAPSLVDARDTRRPPPPLVHSEAMAKVYALIDEVARTTTSILVLGETGVGKDVVARQIHERSDRSSGPMVGLNCAALPESLLESELFGYERGAFTGAVAAKQGLLEFAEGGTVFLDEVGEMPLSTQAKLLRVLEERKVLRVGGLKPKAVDFRLLSATNKNLRAEIQAGRFRADLFYRLNGLALSLPPLRERREEIVPLALHFAGKAAAALGRPVPAFPPETLRYLELYAWPGNIRELRSVVERAVLLARGGAVIREHLPEEVMHDTADAIEADDADMNLDDPIPPEAPTGVLPVLEDDEPEPPSASTGHAPSVRAGPVSLRDDLGAIEHQRILDALNAAGGNQTRAAEALGITRRALIVRLERYGVPRPRRKG